MTLGIEWVLADRPFAEVGGPVLTAADERRGLIAVAGEHGLVGDIARAAPVGVYRTDDLACRALLRSKHPVHAMAFHPALPLLAVGTGRYDGGYFFEGELLLLDVATGAAKSLIEPGLGRQVLGLEWLDDQRLRVVVAPPDDEEGEHAHAEGHVVTVTRPDWAAVPSGSIPQEDLAGPEAAAPRADRRTEARQTINELSTGWDPRRNVRAIRRLSDGRILATLDAIQLECWDPSGTRQWSVPHEGGGRDIAVAADERFAWVGLERLTKEPQAVVRSSLDDGATLDRLQPSAPVSVVRCADGLPALAPAGRNGALGRLRIRSGSRLYFREAIRTSDPLSEGRVWLAAVDLDAVPVAERPREPTEAEVRLLFPYSWVPEENHFGGPGVEVADGSLVYAGTVYDSRGPQPGGSFVVRREMTAGRPIWHFTTDHPATDLDSDDETVYVAYDDGELVALNLPDGTVRWRQKIDVAGIPVIPTALTVTAPNRLLIGTADGRLLTCSTS